MAEDTDYTVTVEYFVEERRPASVGIHRRWLTEEQVAEITATGVYIERATCDCSGFSHFFGPGFDMSKGYGCPGPIPVKSRDCCGAPDDVDEIRRQCQYGCCTILYCPRCCTSTGVAWGPVLCPCDKGSRGHYTAAERTMISNPYGPEYTRRMRARRRRQR